jgi:hypothetical protein
LNRKGDLVGPLVGSLLNPEQYTGGDELSNDPAQVDICGEVASQSGGTDFRSVRYSRLYDQQLTHLEWEKVKVISKIVGFLPMGKCDIR